MKVLVIIGLFACVADSWKLKTDIDFDSDKRVLAIKCYVCDSTDPGCTDRNFIKLKETIDCPEEGAQACLSYTKADKRGAVRACFKGNAEACNTYINNLAKTDNVTNQYCCDKDACNTSSSVFSSVAVSLGFCFVTTVFLTKFF